MYWYSPEKVDTYHSWDLCYLTPVRFLRFYTTWLTGCKGPIQMKLIITRIVLHLASFWKWEFWEIGNGLFNALLPTKPDASEEIYCKWQIYRFATNLVSQATTMNLKKKPIALLQSSLPFFLMRLNPPPRPSPSPPSQTHSTEANRELKQQRRRRLRKRRLKSEVALLQTLSRLIASRSVRQRLAIFTGVEF